jgi:hypothetical protein
MKPTHIMMRDSSIKHSRIACKVKAMFSYIVKIGLLLFGFLLLIGMNFASAWGLWLRLMLSSGCFYLLYLAWREEQE